MNRMQWLQVWGFNPVTTQGRRRQTTPSRPLNGGEAFDALMRRLQIVQRPPQ